MRRPGQSSGDFMSPAFSLSTGGTSPGSLVFFQDPNPGLTFCRELTKTVPAGVWGMVTLLCL